ncbi:MAG: rhodanese-like domain protein [Solirubrobacterales bacterium]|jgi:rhodanese-related sulfurtransferase|nr:rhodanese-like domain protein [Solirubrobacterales bacterium]
MTVEELLAGARSRLRRLDPGEAIEAVGRGAVLVDIRSDSQRDRDGGIPGAVFIPRNVLEWRCDPSSPWRDERVCDAKRQLILFCDEGYQSSLAAATLSELGRRGATDLVGGFRAWRAQGLPTERLSGAVGDGHGVPHRAEPRSSLHGHTHAVPGG